MNAATKTTPPPIGVSTEERAHMIAVAAYFNAEKRGFEGCDEDQVRDWLEAERAIDAMLESLLAGGPPGRR